jgi:hypothetical protein
MANENTVSIQIPADDLKKITDAFKLIEDTLKPYLVSLTSDERKTLPKMGDKTIPFVEKVTEYAITNPEFAPSYMRPQELLIDFKAVSDLTLFLRPTEQLSSTLNDTILLSGSEAYSEALIYYNSVKQAAKNNVPNAKTIFEDLKKRFENNKVKK